MEISETERAEFQQNLLLLRSKEDHLKEIRQTLKNVRADLMPVKDRVMQFMQTKGVQSCNLGECRLVIEEKTRLPTFNLKYLEADVLPKFLSPDRIEDLKAFVDEDRRRRSTTVRTIVAKEPKKKTIGDNQIRAPPPATLPVQQTLHSTIANLYS